MAETHRVRRSGPVAIGRRPIASLLLPIPIVCFLGAVLSDWSYLGSGGNLTWLYFSTWLLAAGLFLGVFAAIALVADAVRGGTWLAVLLFAATWIVELINSLVHARDGWTAVAGLGFILSILGALLALASGWFAAERREFIGFENE
jgi:uncharacterized membrane protein